MKLVFWTIVLFVINLPIAFAQTGLFDAGNAGTFAITGITFVIVIIVLREVFKSFFKKK